MNQLLPIGSAVIGGALIKTVDARTLHTFLAVKKDFSSWLKARIDQYGFVEGHDYVLPQNGERQNQALSGNGRIDYFLTIDMAKELSMVERNAQGKRARQYFIECERALLSQPQFETPQTMPEALRMAADALEQKAIAEAKVEALAATVAAQAPKIELIDRVMKKAVDLSFTNGSKVLKKEYGVKVTRKRLIEWLEEKRIVYRRKRTDGTRGRPIASDYGISRGWVRQKWGNERDENELGPMEYDQCFITPKGIEEIGKLLGAQERKQA